MMHITTVHFDDANGDLHSIWPGIERGWTIEGDKQTDLEWAVRQARRRGGRNIRFDVMDDTTGRCVARGKVRVSP